ADPRSALARLRAVVRLAAGPQDGLVAGAADGERLADEDSPVVAPRLEQDDVAGPGPVDGLLDRAPRLHHVNPAVRRRLPGRHEGRERRGRAERDSESPPHPFPPFLCGQLGMPATSWPGDFLAHPGPRRQRDRGGKRKLAGTPQDFAVPSETSEHFRPDPVTTPAHTRASPRKWVRAFGASRVVST